MASFSDPIEDNLGFTKLKKGNNIGRFPSDFYMSVLQVFVPGEDGKKMLKFIPGKADILDEFLDKNPDMKSKIDIGKAFYGPWVPGEIKTVKSKKTGKPIKKIVFSNDIEILRFGKTVRDKLANIHTDDMYNSNEDESLNGVSCLDLKIVRSGEGLKTNYDVYVYNPQKPYKLKNIEGLDEIIKKIKKMCEPTDISTVKSVLFGEKEDEELEESEDFEEESEEETDEAGEESDEEESEEEETEEDSDSDDSDDDLKGLDLNLDDEEEEKPKKAKKGRPKKKK